MTQQIETQLAPIKVGAGEGEARWWFGALAEIKATAADTGGQMTIVEVTEHPGAEAPLHVHHREDEGFWVLEGTVTFEVGETTIEATAGDYLFAPRDIPHRFVVATAAAGCSSSWCRAASRTSSGRRAGRRRAARSRPAPSPSRPRSRSSSSRRRSGSTDASC
jgi:quercetin dioxygenase-like cupin family protein